MDYKLFLITLILPIVEVSAVVVVVVIVVANKKS